MPNLGKVFILFLLLLAGELLAQTPTVRFQHIGVEEGLSQNSVMDIVQDSTGFLWIATRDGLNRYDGYEIKVYRNDYEDSTSISSNIIRKLMIDSKDRLWITVEGGGLLLYRKKTDDFKSIFTKINNKRISITTTLLEDDKGYLWFGIDKIGVVKFNPETNTHKVIPILEDTRKNVFYSLEQINNEVWVTTRDSGVIMIDKNKEQISRKSIQFSDNMGLDPKTRVVEMSDDGEVYVGTLNGVYKYHFEEKRFYHFEMEGWNPQYAEVFALVAKDSTLWFASKSNGLFRFNLKNRDLTLYTSNSKSKYALTHSFITSIYQDSQRNIWVGTFGGGVNKMNIDIPFKLYTHDDDDPFSLANASSRKILKDKEGNIVVASYNGVRIFNNQTQTAFNLPYHKDVEIHHKELAHVSMLSQAIHALKWENDHQLWLGNEGNGVQLYDFNTNRYESYNLKSQHSIDFKSNFVVNLEKDNKGTLWAATHDGLYYKDSLDNQFKNYSLNKEQEPEVFNIHALPNGPLFVASQNGLHYINGKNNQLINCKNLPEHLNERNCMMNSRLSYINQFNDSTLLIGSTGNGLIEVVYVFKGNELKIKKFKVIDNEFIKEQTVYAILKQNDSIVWFSSNDGLFKYNFHKNDVFNYTLMDGLQGNEFNYESFYKDEGGIMYFGGISGINAFNPEEVKLEKQEAKLYFSTIQFGDSIISNLYAKDKLSTITIPYDDNHIFVKYLGINLDRPNNTNYFVQLLGVDSEPVAMGKQREVNFFNLEPGHYELRVWAANLNTITPNNKNFKTLSFFISPPFYMSLWFKVLVIALIALSLIIGIRLRLRGLLKDKERLKKEIQLSQKEIENQKLESEIATSKAVIKGQNIEQKRISEELHDGIGHLLTAASLNISAIKSYIDKGLWEKLPDEVRNVSEILNQSISEVRNVSHNLMPNLLIEEGLESAINEFVRRIQRSSSVDIEFKSENLSDRFNMEIAVSIFRMIQETVNNCLRHSQASEISILVKQKDEKVSISIKDNGIGFDQKSMKNSTGLGLKNLQARTELNRGEFNISSQKNKGTEVHIIIPLT